MTEPTFNSLRTTLASAPMGLIGVALLVACSFVGCKEAPKINQYEVPKPQSDFSKGKFTIIDSTPAKPTWPVPEGWDYVGKGSFGVIHKITKSIDGETTLVSVSKLRSAAADWPANVDRWAAGQLGIKLDGEAIKSRTKEVTVDGLTGKLIVLDDEGTTDGKATIAAMVERGNDVWVFKSMGKAAAVKATESEFRDYLKSFKFK